MIGLCAVPVAHAELLIKGVKCKDAEAEIPVFWNTATFDKHITVQIVRDGCRPKLADGQFGLRTGLPNGGSSNSIFQRSGKHTHATYKRIPAGYIAMIRFISLSGRPVGGTFDYVLEPG